MKYYVKRATLIYDNAGDSTLVLEVLHETDSEEEAQLLVNFVGDTTKNNELVYFKEAK